MGPLFKISLGIWLRIILLQTICAFGFGIYYEGSRDMIVYPVFAVINFLITFHLVFVIYFVVCKVNSIPYSITARLGLIIFSILVLYFTNYLIFMKITSGDSWQKLLIDIFEEQAVWKLLGLSLIIIWLSVGWSKTSLTNAYYTNSNNK